MKSFIIYLFIIHLFINQYIDLSIYLFFATL